MTVFQDLVGYIGQVDKALGLLKAKNADAFSHMFDGLDANLKNQLESIFGISGLHLDQFTVLNEKLGTFDLTSKIKDVKEFAIVINDLYTSIGAKAPIDLNDFVKKRKVTQTHIDAITNAVTNFATVLQDVSTKVAGGFGVGGGFGAPNKEIQAQIEKLKKQQKEYREILDIFSGDEDLKIETNAENEVEEVQKLIEKVI